MMYIKKAFNPIVSSEIKLSNKKLLNSLRVGVPHTGET